MWIHKSYFSSQWTGQRVRCLYSKLVSFLLQWDITCTSAEDEFCMDVELEVCTQSSVSRGMEAFMSFKIRNGWENGMVQMSIV